MKIMSKVSSKLGVKALISSAISLGGGGGYLSLLSTLKSKRFDGYFNACFCYVENSKSTPNNNENLGFFVYVCNTS